MRKIIFFISLAFISASNIMAQESRAENNADYDFQQGRKLFDQKQYAISSQYFTDYLNQQKSKDMCELCQEEEYYIAVSAYKLRDKNATDILEAYIEKYPYTPMRSYINFLINVYRTIANSISIPFIFTIIVFLT